LVMPPDLKAAALAFMLAALATLGTEQLLLPRPVPPWRRPGAALCVHLGTLLSLFIPLLLLLRRPWFAAALLAALFLFLVLVSNAKYRSLREPFVYQGLSYFVDALRFPRLYLPFLGCRSALAAVLGVAAAVASGLLLEAPLGWRATARLALALFPAALVLLAGRRVPSVGGAFDPVQDTRRLGLVGTIWSYGAAERAPWRGAACASFQCGGDATDGELPNLVVIQSESFFDPRRWIEGVSGSLLDNFDALKREAAGRGTLEVPAWGANTVRTEFSFLSGIANERLGVHKFKPYRRVARQGIATVVGHLKKRGYRTVCLHPYHARFYGRTEVLPRLGFYEIIDITRFAAGDRFGQYVGDAAVAREVARELAGHDSPGSPPLFLFVITMENHGPLQLERARPEDRARLHGTPPPDGCDELTVYLRHLEQADLALGAVRERLAAMQRPGWLCLYGDHAPIMPRVYRQLGEPDGSVDYLIWSNRGEGGAPERTLRVEELAELLLRRAGVLDGRGEAAAA
jgi:hypothetical protein